ncbi:hypothetical protein ANN_03090 [Periplaneta americana]|uniref:Reverse transcriptase domain-containing protein n=1 Tax=Periplaneta americana TaxID=6978 RepID=A0ABQ8U0P0_PERAM|nr:hypothetical protein ANN_03090 [Periplaneta americana]
MTFLSQNCDFKVCFSDESTFQCLMDKAMFVRRRKGEYFAPGCPVNTVKHPISVMIWSVISGKVSGRLYIVQGTIKQNQYIQFHKYYYVQIDDNIDRSQPLEQTNGVLQGDPLSPLLFNIATSDVYKDIEADNVKIYAYADDMVILSTDIDDLQTAFNHLKEWANKNELLLNEKKTVTMTFRKGGRAAANDVIMYGTEPLTRVPHFKYLGITMQTQGNVYTLHVKERAAAAVIAMNGIKNLHKISLSTAMKLFELKITPIITYGIDLIWEHLTKNNLSDIERVKATFLKKALCLSKYTPSRLTYVLSKESFYIEDLRYQLLLTSTKAYDDLLQELKAKRAEICMEFYVTDAMMNTEWKKANYELRHVMTRFAVHGFHFKLCSVENTTSQMITVYRYECETSFLEFSHKFPKRKISFVRDRAYLLGFRTKPIRRKLDELSEGKHPYQEKEPLPPWPDNTNPKTGELFRLRYNIHCNDPIPSAHAIKIWIQNFEVADSALKKKSSGKQRSVHTPENINAIRVAMICSPKRSAHRHAISLGLSNISIRRILHKDLHMHPYKIQVVLTLKDADKFLNSWHVSDIVKNMAEQVSGEVCVENDCVIEGLLKVPFNRRTYNEKVEIVKMERPTPELNLSMDVKEKQHKKSRHSILLARGTVSKLKHTISEFRRSGFPSIWSNMENENSSDNTMEPPLKRRKGDDELKYRQLYYSILDRMHMEITDRFSDYEKLQFTHLLDSQKFSAYRENFPNEALNKLFQSYNSHFDQVRLKNELSVIYSAEVFDFSNKPIHEILSAIYENQLNQVIPEVLKLATLIVTIPATSASVERTFSALKRIKSYCRSTHTQERLSGLALMSIEKSFLQKLRKRPNCNFNDEVIKVFSSQSRRLEFTYK